ncbi:hypothetical protein [Thalassolituus oleivorans]|jgi:hypothetical protein|uniref:ArsR family transcriptional regulator n=1 Tax=Thalassolituus oleivorans MIL-1 TaxID=1298593 RepID=M5DZJ0_9GAMM|nr:hypothetical protein [Thalassolituus oleivorans]CCU70919.1 hypothetical protein TOL_0480 [Thalassolituus oleivorans MIL-1]
MSYNDIVTEDQRLVILRSLKEAPGGKSNDSMLHKMLGIWGHHISRDKVKSHLYWLAEMELLEVETILSTDVVKITSRGFDVAEGSASVPGVATPRPGA